MGFIRDIKKIIAKLPTQRQTLLFSATMPQDIAELARQMLKDPARVAVTPEATTVERIVQRVIHVDRGGKSKLLSDLLRQETVDRVLVFTRTKHGADKVVRGLNKDGIAAEAIHGNKSQNQRERVLANFRNGRTRTLVATDIAARGIDVEGISHVINYDLPNIPESYVHRIGRTARAGADGIAISLCSHDERPFLRDIEKLIRMAIPASGQVPASQPTQRPPQHQQQRNGHNRNEQRNGRNAHRNGRPSRQAERQQDRQQSRPQHSQRPRAEQPAASHGEIAAVAFLQPR
jgi:ATP-dependent RNA helicase RhlE